MLLIFFCNNGIEDMYHYVFTCKLCYENRLNLINVMRNISRFDLNILFHGDDNKSLEESKEIFRSVDHYIEFVR